MWCKKAKRGWDLKSNKRREKTRESPVSVSSSPRGWGSANGLHVCTWTGCQDARWSLKHQQKHLNGLRWLTASVPLLLYTSTDLLYTYSILGWGAFCCRGIALSAAGLRSLPGAITFSWSFISFLWNVGRVFVCRVEVSVYRTTQFYVGSRFVKFASP